MLFNWLFRQMHDAKPSSSASCELLSNNSSGSQESSQTSQLPNDLIEQAKREGCGISTSQSTRCFTTHQSSHDNDNSQDPRGLQRCERETTYYKLCPGRAPQKIYSTRTETDEPMSSFGDDFPTPFGRRLDEEREFGDLFGAFGDIARSFEEAFRGGRGMGGSLQDIPFPRGPTEEPSGRIPWAHEREARKQFEESQKRHPNENGGTYI